MSANPTPERIAAIRRCVAGYTASGWARDVHDLLAALDAVTERLAECERQRDEAVMVERRMATLLSQAPLPLSWTTSPPTSPGWYWRRFVADGPVAVVLVEGEMYGVAGETPRPGMFSGHEHGHCHAALVGYSAEWAGPIPQPQDPEGGTR